MMTLLKKKGGFSFGFIAEMKSKEVLPLFFLAFFISYNYTVFKPIKDTLMLFPNDCGGEVIPFIKVWGILPFAIIGTALFTWLSARFSQKVVLFFFVIGFSLFFLCFAFLLYPFYRQLALDSLADYLSFLLPNGLRGLVAMVRHWSFSLFYIMSEMWGIIITHVIFWNLVIQRTKMADASRTYSFVVFGYNLGSIVAGFFSSRFFLLSTESMNHAAHSWEKSLEYVILSTTMASFCILAIFHSAIRQNISYVKLSKKRSLSLFESIRYLFHSRYLLFVTFIVLSYNITNTLLEVVWKDQMKQVFQNPSEYCVYFSKIITSIGIASAIVSWFILAPLMQRFRWKQVASISPLLILCFGLLFFNFIFFRNFWKAWLPLYFGITIEQAILFSGSALMVIMRTLKYTLFDTTKEVALTPLSQEAKLKGKSVIDGISSRLGKSGASVTYQILLVLCSGFIASLPYVSCMIFFFLGSWLFSIRQVSEQFEKLIKRKKT